MAIRYFKLLDLMNKRGLTKGDLKKMSGISSVTMAKITKGDSVTVEIINRICAALDVQPGDIMEYIPDATEQSEA